MHTLSLNYAHPLGGFSTFFDERLPNDTLTLYSKIVQYYGGALNAQKIPTYFSTCILVPVYMAHVRKG